MYTLTATIACAVFHFLSERQVPYIAEGTLKAELVDAGQFGSFISIYGRFIMMHCYDKSNILHSLLYSIICQYATVLPGTGHGRDILAAGERQCRLRKFFIPAPCGRVPVHAAQQHPAPVRLASSTLGPCPSYPAITNAGYSGRQGTQQGSDR